MAKQASKINKLSKTKQQKPSCWGGMVEADELTDEGIVGRGGMTALRASKQAALSTKETHRHRLKESWRCDVIE